MAKISARGARAVETATADLTIDGATYTYRLVLCSDGRILSRLMSASNDPFGNITYRERYILLQRRYRGNLQFFAEFLGYENFRKVK